MHKAIVLALFSVLSQVGQTQQIITTIAGGATHNGEGEPAVNAQVKPRGSAVDGAGNFYFSDTYDNSVRKIDAVTGIIKTVAGNGTAGFSGDNGFAVSAQLNSPQGIEIDGSGNLYIADGNNYRIRKVNLSTGIITTVVGTGTRGYSGDGGLGIFAQIGIPTSIVSDGSGNLYISDDRIRKVNLSTGTISTVSSSASTSAPEGMALDVANNIYFASNYDIKKVDAVTGVITTVAGNGTIGYSGDNGLATRAQLYFPSGVNIDGSGNLYICDLFNSRIRKVNSSTGIITTVVGTGIQGFSGDNGLAINAQIDYPFAALIDGSNNIYVLNTLGYRIRKVNSSGIISTLAGTGLIGTTNDNVLATAAQLYTQVGSGGQGITVDSQGNSYFCDSNNRIRKVDANSGIITTIAGTGIPGYTGDNGPAINANINSGPLEVDAAGNIYVLGYYSVRKITIATGLITSVAGNGTNGSSGDGGLAINAQLNIPQAFAIDASGNIYIGDLGNRIRKVDGSTGIITTIAGTDGSGFSGDNGLAINAELNPAGLAVDEVGNIYIADINNNRIRKITAGIITTVAGSNNQGNSGDNGPATLATLTLPSAIATDKFGNVYISNGAEFSSIRKINSAGIITTLAGNFKGGYSGDNGPAQLAQIYSPNRLVTDSNGNLYFVDSGNNRIRKITNAKGDQTITFNSLPVKKYGDGPFVLTATSSSGLSVTYSSSNTNVAIVSNNTLTIVGAGTVNITASQAGNGNYNQATNVMQDLTIIKGDQGITFATIADKKAGDAAFTLGATSTSSLVIGYTTPSDKVTISGSTVTIVKAGSVTINADQAGNTNYNAAPRVQQTFCINPARPTISISNGNSENPILTSSATGGNQWYENGTAITGASNGTLSVTSPGVYSVESTVETCKSVRSADFPIITTGDIVLFGAKVLEISPNPTSNFILMKLPGEGKKELDIFNPNGRLQEGSSTELNQISVDVRHYAAGYYLVRVSTVTGIYYGKFIKK